MVEVMVYMDTSNLLILLSRTWYAQRNWLVLPGICAHLHKFLFKGCYIIRCRKCIWRRSQPRTLASHASALGTPPVEASSSRYYHHLWLACSIRIVYATRISYGVPRFGYRLCLIRRSTLLSMASSSHRRLSVFNPRILSSRYATVFVERNAHQHLQKHIK